MRKLMWFTIGFALACGLSVWVLPLAGVLLSIAAAAAATGLLLKYGVKRLALIAFGCALGFCWYAGFTGLYLQPALSMDATTEYITVTATAHSYETDYGVGVDGEFMHHGRKMKIRLYVNDAVEITPGDLVEGSYNFRYTAPGGKRNPTYHAGDGVLLLGYPRGKTAILPAVRKTLLQKAQGLNHAIGCRLDAIFPEETAPYARALLLGDGSGLDYETDTAFRLSGIRHIIAVSGLHVAMLYSAVRLLAMNRRWLIALLGYPVLYLFAMAAGFTPSVTRACIMVGLMMLSQLLEREYDSAAALSFAGLVMLLWNPLVITSISFQMSFACVAGILLFDAPISRWLTGKLGTPKGRGLTARLKRWVISSVSVSLSAISLTTPISAYYFGVVSLVGVLTNLLTLWAVSVSFYGIVAALGVSLIWLSGGCFLGKLTSLFMRYVITVAKLLSSVPLAAVYTASVYIVLWLIFVYVLLAVFLACKKRCTGVLLCCASMGLCLALLVSWMEYRFSDTHFTALDVGQGQCLILHTDGKTYLIDCGGSNDEIAANMAADTLLSRGITRLDGLILTHGDRDHGGGVAHLLTRIDTNFLMLPATIPTDTREKLTGGWKGNVMDVEEDLFLQAGAAKITIFGPDFPGESNENSLCILFESEKCAILITGDRNSFGEMLLLRRAALPEVDLLIAGHHGSKKAASEPLLEMTRPETVFISVGQNSYGHPARELLDRLKRFGCTVYRTDLHGNLIFRR